MAIEIRETFQVAAPIEQVWSFMKSPENLAGCMPGASITQLIDERSFIGTVKLRVGAITASYDGTMSFIKLDESTREMTLLAEAKEKGGGTVSGTISASLVAQPDGSTEVRCESSTDLTGRIVQVGRGMIEGVSKQIIQKFVANVKGMLETASAAAPVTADSSGTPVSPPPPPPVKEDSINVLAVVFKVLMDRLRAFFRRVFGRA